VTAATTRWCSCGTGFTGGEKWSQRACVGPAICLLGDVNGDGRSDIASVERPAGGVSVTTSTGSAFATAGVTTPGVCGEPAGSCAIGDVNGDGSADTVNFVRSAYTDSRQGNVMVAPAAKLAPAALQPLTVSGTRVTVTWTDQSVSENRFEILRQTGPADPLHRVGDVATRGRATLSGSYTFTDTITAGTRMCYDIRSYDGRGTSAYSNEVCTAARPLPATPATGRGLQSVLNTQGATGSRPAVALGRDGRGVVSYSTSTGLFAAHCDDVTCSSSTSRRIDAAAVGTESSIAIGGDGLPLIAYRRGSEAWVASTTTRPGSSCGFCTAPTWPAPDPSPTPSEARHLIVGGCECVSSVEVADVLETIASCCLATLERAVGRGDGAGDGGLLGGLRRAGI